MKTARELELDEDGCGGSGAARSSDAYYVLNPGGDLARTQATFETAFAEPPWEGVAGRPPPVDAVREALQLLKDTGAAGVATYLRKIREDETTAAELERKLTRKPWSFSTWAPLPPTKEEEEKQLRAKRRAGRNNIPRP